MTWGTVTIGGISLRETSDAQRDGSEVRISGQEANPPRSVAHVESVHANLTSMVGRTVPAVFTDKDELTAFYLVTGARAEMDTWAGGTLPSVSWEVGLARLGTERDVEIESLVPTIDRQTAHAVTPVFWHATPVGVTSYHTGPTVPASSITRDSADGPVPVHLGIPEDVSPRWNATAENYLKGSVRLLFDGVQYVTQDTPEAVTWEMNNGLVRVQPGASDGQVSISAWDDAAWRSVKSFSITEAGVGLATDPEPTILRNEPEEAVLRLTYPTTAGRTTVDLSLRRGSRFVTGVIKRHSAIALGVRPAPTESTGTLATGGIMHAADADGNRTVLGSAAAVTASAANGGISLASATRLDFFLGHQVGTPAAGDAYADLMAQYLGTMGEQARIVRRGWWSV